MITVKRGDTHSISWSTNLDLTGASVTVWARPKSGSSVQLTTVITDADDGEFSHTLTGALAVGEYRVEAEIHLPDGQIVTAPSDSYASLLVLEDLG